MRVLAVDTTTTVAAAALLEDNILIGEIIQNYKKTHSQKLMHIIDELLSSRGLSPEDIDLFACASGPGSFTGLRIGAATIKGMAQAVSKPIVGVPTLDALAYNLYNCKGLVCPILDAQRGMVYAALYHWESMELKKEEDFRIIDMDELIQRLREKGEAVTFLGDGVALFEDKIRSSMLEASIAPAAHMLPRASSCGALALQMYEKGISQCYDEFLPTYIRKSQAEVEYEKKQTVEICEMTLDDIEAVYEIEELSFATPWSKESFVSEIRDNRLAKYVVAKVGGKVAGYGGMWLVIDEAHITNVAVHPDYRGQKIGEKLVIALADITRENNGERMTLEVRVTNTPARNLYKKMSFTDCGVRKGYYSDSGEDAIIMWRELERSQD